MQKIMTDSLLPDDITAVYRIMINLIYGRVSNHYLKERRLDIMGSSRNAEIFEETFNLCKNEPALRRSILDSIERQDIVLSDRDVAVEKERSLKTTVELIAARCIEATVALEGRTCVLNFANYYRPGGGVRGGAAAQEEAICRVTTLYPCISSDRPKELFYNPHWKEDNLASNDLIYTPDVVVIREDTEGMDLLPPDMRYNIDVITCAAPVYSGQDKGFMSVLFEKRFDRIMDAASAHDVDNIILGAFGCGVFGNDPRIVAEAAKRSSEKHMGLFRRIIFAVPQGGNNYAQFGKVFQAGNG